MVKVGTERNRLSYHIIWFTTHVPIIYLDVRPSLTLSGILATTEIVEYNLEYVLVCPPSTQTLPLDVWPFDIPCTIIWNSKPREHKKEHTSVSSPSPAGTPWVRRWQFLSDKTCGIPWAEKSIPNGEYYWLKLFYKYLQQERNPFEEIILECYNFCNRYL